MLSNLRFILIMLFTLLLNSCATTSKKETIIHENYTAPQLFEQGVRNFENQNYKKAKEFFIAITQDYPYAKEAAKAQYLEAYTNYKLKDYDSTILALTEYIDLYPAGEDIENAYYLKAKTYFDQIIEIRLDQSITEKALDAFNELLARFPNSKYAQDAKLKIDLIYDQLAGKEMSIGKFYLKNNVIEAAINRFQNIVEKYNTAAHIEEALYRLVESYLILGIKEQAIKYGAILGNNYPASHWYKKAYQLLQHAK